MSSVPFLIRELQQRHPIQLVRAPEEASENAPFLLLGVPNNLGELLPWYKRGMIACIHEDDLEEQLPYLEILLEDMPCNRLHPEGTTEYWLKPDFRALDLLSGGNPALRNRMLDLFKQMLDEELPKIHNNIAQHKWLEFSKSVHKLKSNFRSLGMTQMQIWSEDLELAARLRACLPKLQAGAVLFDNILQQNLRTF